MVAVDVVVCPECGGDLIFYDTVPRIVRTKNRQARWDSLRRLQCVVCNCVHRELPDYICPHKHYETEVILGVLEGHITSDTLGFENYPCEATMIRWKSHILSSSTLFLQSRFSNLE